MMRIFAGIACALFVGAAFGAQPLGRFFFTPAERAQLDAARVEKKKPAPASVVEHPPEPLPVPQTVTYGGIVRRSDGKSMLWINNRLADEKEALAGLNLRGRVRSDGAVTLQVPDTGSSVEIKVGQSVELQTGKVAEGRRADSKESKEPVDAKAAEDTKDGAPVTKAEPLQKSTSALPPSQRTAPASRGESAPEQALRPREDAKEQRAAAPGR